MSAIRDNKEAFRDSIGTVDADGRRKWVYPKKPKGRYYNWRSYLSYALLLVLFGLPWIKIGGEPLIMLNVLERKFILFGLSFSPQDFHLFAILMITAVVFISLFTVIFGRLFCGWVCPQTIFMEMVFRKVEYWIEGDANAQRRLNKAPWTAVKIRKKAVKHTIFLFISGVIAHTFLSYIIGTDAVLATVSQSPFVAPGGFLAIVAFIGIFYFVFARMREQVCIAICPYGRLQGVLLDDTSINVIYDYVRGEPRGKLSKGHPKKSSCTDCEDCRTGKSACVDRVLEHMEASLSKLEPPQPAPKGDCIDCKLCVQVCPTGIDIRNGIQMECVNCTACIDACDEVMDKIEKPRGLIRFDSESGVARGERKVWTPRVFAYSGVLLALIALNIVLLGSRDGLDVILLRTPGLLYQENQDGSINNLYSFQIVNKTGEELPLEFRVIDFDGNVRPVGEAPIAEVGEVTEGALFIDLPAKFKTPFDGEVQVEVWSGDKHLETISTTFIHPEKQ